MLTRSLTKLCLQSPNSCRHLSNNSPNYLLLLPEEIFAYLLCYLSIEDCGQLSLTSTQLRDRLQSWLGSSWCLRHSTRTLLGRKTGMVDHQAEYEGWITVSKQYGVLCKRVSMLYCTNRRLNLLVCWFKSLASVGCDDLNSTWGRLCSRAGLGACLHTFTLGWDVCELEKVIPILKEMFPVLQIRWSGLHQISSPELRNILRTIFWDHVPEDASYSWLSLLLKFAIPSHLLQVDRAHHVASLLLEILGPVDETPALLLENFGPFQQSVFTTQLCPQDRTLLQTITPETYSEAKEIFAELGKALRLLHKFQQMSTNNSSKQLQEVMAALFKGNDWLPDNQAACILFSSEPVVRLYLGQLARDNKESLARTLSSMVAMCGRFNNDLKQGMSNILDWVFTTFPVGERSKIIDEFWQETMERIEQDDFNDDILIQLGVYIGKRSFPPGYNKNVMFENSVDMAEE